MNHRRYTYLVGEDILLLKRRYTSFLKETHRSFIRGGIGALLLLLLTLTACVGEELQKPLLGEGEGYLTLQIGAISAEIQTSPLTKTPTELDASLVPAPKDLTIHIHSGGTSVAGFPKFYREITGPLVLKTGTYIVEAYHGDDNDIQEKPYFYGSDTVEVKALQTATTTIVAKLANAMIIPVVTDSLRRHYKNDWTLTASVGETSFTLASATEGIDTLYAKTRKAVTFTFSGTNLAGKKVSSSWDKTFDAGYAYQLQCNPDLDAFKNIQVTATVKHTYDNGYLTGTEVELNSNLMEANKEAIKEWNVAIEYNRRIIRTYKGNDAPNITMERIEDWPYIPQSSELSASVTLKSGDVIAVSSTFAVPAPDFGVAVSAYTSYDKYLKHDITAANNCQPETMYDIQASAKISADLLNNSNYNHSFQLLLDGENEIGSSTSTTINVEKKEGLSWAAHTLKAVMTFAGSECSKESVHHITGLPYKAEPPKIKGDFAWSKDGGGLWDGTDEYAKLSNGGGECTLTSPSFYVTSNINVNVSTKYVVHKATVSTTFTMKLGSTIIFQTNHSGTIHTNKKVESTVNTAMSSSDNYIWCNNSYGFGATHSKVYYVNIDYNNP